MIELNLTRVLTDLWKQGYFNIESQPEGAELGAMTPNYLYEVGDPVIRSLSGQTKGQFVLATDLTSVGELKFLVIRKDKFVNNDYCPAYTENVALETQNRKNWDWISPKTHFAVERRTKDDIFAVGEAVFIGDNGAYKKTGTNQLGYVERVGSMIKEDSVNVPSFIFVRYQPSVVSSGGNR